MAQVTNTVAFLSTSAEVQRYGLWRFPPLTKFVSNISGSVLKGSSSSWYLVHLSVVNTGDVSGISCISIEYYDYWSQWGTEVPGKKVRSTIKRNHHA